MKISRYISIAFAAALLLVAQKTQAQVSATARVTLTVIAAPGINITPASQQSGATSSVAANRIADQPGIRFTSSQNVLVQLNTPNSIRSRFDLQQGQFKEISENELRGISKVEVVYLGS